MELALRKEIIIDKKACRAFGVTAFVLLTALGAFVRVPLPFTPVPLTLQTFFVLLGAVSLGRRLGAMTQWIYISLGALGIPLFSLGGSGLSYLAGPTGGYLFGFVLAAVFAGSFMKAAGRNFYLTFAVIFSADLILLSCGTLWLKILFGLTMGNAFSMGFLPFIPGDILKAMAVALVFLKTEARLRKVL
jgi:biotin transport system substrate-specific component